MKKEQLKSLDEHNLTLIFKTPKNADNPYIIISRKMSRDNRLNVTEKGILLNILDSNIDYQFIRDIEFKKSGVDEYTFNKAIKHLIELDYIIALKFNVIEYWVINECPNASLITNKNFEENINNLININNEKYKKPMDLLVSKTIIFNLLNVYKENNELIKASKKEYFKNK